jgi:hypothetical protein
MNDHQVDALKDLHRMATGWKDYMPGPAESIRNAATQFESLIAEAKELRAALAPFVDSYNLDADPIGDSDLYGEQPRSVRVTLGDCRKAARIAATHCPVCGAAPGGKHV